MCAHVCVNVCVKEKRKQIKVILIKISLFYSCRFYIDPALSLLLVILILRSVWPLLQESALILLQTVPTHIQVIFFIQQYKDFLNIYKIYKVYLY
jgi:Co/Zn/Cd efflux system component